MIYFLSNIVNYKKNYGKSLTVDEAIEKSVTFAKSGKLNLFLCK